MDHRSNRAFALIELLVAIMITSIVISLLLAAVQKMRAAASRSQCQNNLRQLGLALHGYEAVKSHLPPGLNLASDNRTFRYMGWPARVLPYLEQEPLWADVQAAFAGDPDQDNFYGSAAQLKIMGTPVKILNCPADARLPRPVTISRRQYTYTSYLGSNGTDSQSHNGVLYLDSAVAMRAIADGTSCTLLAGERPPAANLLLGWWYRGWGQAKDGSAEMHLGVRELNTGAAGCSSGVYQYRVGQFDNQCDSLHFWSPHAGGANFAFCDGSVRFLTYAADAIMPSLATRAGGEIVEIP